MPSYREANINQLSSCSLITFFLLHLQKNMVPFVRACVRSSALCLFFIVFFDSSPCLSWQSIWNALKLVCYLFFFRNLTEVLPSRSSGSTCQTSWMPGSASPIHPPRCSARQPTASVTSDGSTEQSSGKCLPPSGASCDVTTIHSVKTEQPDDSVFTIPCDPRNIFQRWRGPRQHAPWA